MSDLTKVRTTIRPDEEIEVNSQELLDLQRQGLLVSDNVITSDVVEDETSGKGRTEKKENN